MDRYGITSSTNQPAHKHKQGIILYNTVNYWDNPLLTLVDLVRVRDDFGRFQFAHNHLHFPIHGFHGSFMLVRGAVEHDVTWDTSVLTEDMWFALVVSPIYAYLKQYPLTFTGLAKRV